MGFTKRILHLVKRGNSMRRSRYSTSRMRSKLVIPLLALCDVAVRHAAFQNSSGKWAKKQAGKKMDDPHALKSNEMAQCTFQPQQPLVCDSFKNCEGLSRVAFMDGNGVVMLGKVISCEKKEADAAGGKKK